MPRLPVIIAVLLGMLLGVGAFTFQYAKGLAYFSNDPNACANCHIMREQLESWQKSSHHGKRRLQRLPHASLDYSEADYESR
jgi:cytochrome c nitrite reductase small subunit